MPRPGVLLRALAAGLCAALAADAAAADMATDVVLGWREFRRPWTPPPRLNTRDGLGPLFNATSCRGCHLGPALAGRLLDGEGRRIEARGLAV